MSIETAAPESEQLRDLQSRMDAKQAQSNRGLHAQQILDNPVFDEAFESVYAALQDKLEQQDLRDAEEVARIVLQQRMLGKVKQQLKSFVASGHAADRDLIEQRKAFEREQKRLDDEANGMIARGMRFARGMGRRGGAAPMQ